MINLDDVDYTRPIALMPLSCVTLLPHTLQPLYIFEVQFRQMVEDALSDGGLPGHALDAAPIAMAIQDLSSKSTDPQKLPCLRPVVCVGRIVQHAMLPDGRHTIMLHGVARARILRLHQAEGRRLYHMAHLEPLEPPLEPRPPMRRARQVIRDLLAGDRLRKLQNATTLLDWMDREEVPTHVVVEHLAYTFVRAPERRYQLLAEPRPLARARMVRDELVEIDRLITAALRQGSEEWPKGLAWN